MCEDTRPRSPEHEQHVEANMCNHGIRFGCGGAWLLALCGLCLSVQALAEELPKESVLPLKLAVQAALHAERQCAKDGYRVSASVVDRAGVLQVLVRGDGAGPHTVDSSRRKAYTAASLRVSTQELAELISQRPELQALEDMNSSILLLGGGFPVTMGGEGVGGIGVGGAPGTALDEACARTGLQHIGADTYQTAPKSK
jgi:uncharacterized protein GlcG (DUF336 family)